MRAMKLTPLDPIDKTSGWDLTRRTDVQRFKDTIKRKEALAHALVTELSYLQHSF